MAQRIVNSEQYESFLIKGGDDGGVLAIRNNGGESSVIFYRPNDTTAYSANDAIAANGASHVVFSGLLNEGADIYITNASLLFESASVPAGMGSFRLHLYNQTPSGTVDNAAFTMASGDATKYKGYIEIVSPATVGGNYIYRRNETVNVQVALASGESSLYGVLQTLNGWTPAANSQIKLSISYFPA